MKFKSYKEAQKHQLREWVNGRPWHNPWAPDGSYGEGKCDGECCPDFSCCSPMGMWDEKARKTFAASSPEVREGMLMFGLERVVRDNFQKDIHIAGATTPDTNH